MKKIILQLFVLLLVLPSKFLFAQEKQQFNTDNIPVDKISKLITYTDVVQLKGVSTAVLYKRALDWFNTYYKNPADVIRESDSTKGTIVGKSRFKISNAPDKKGLRTDAGLIMYTIKVSVREGRYKYEITELNQKAASYTPLEPWLDNTAYADYLEQIDTELRDTIDSLRKAMSTKPPVKNDNW